MGAVIDFIFTAVLALVGLAVGLVVLFCTVVFVVMATKKIIEEVRKDGGTE